MQRSESGRPRARDLLQAYYKTAVPKDPPKEPTPYDIDSEIFNSPLFLTKFLRETHLVDVIRKDSELITEIKEIDGNMKTLVYENYDKFISATDTIKQMKSTVDTMDAEIDKLCIMMDTISSRTKHISDDMSEKRTQIQALYKANELLNKLNFIFELPAQLKKCFKDGRYEHAVFYYNRTALMIDQYSDQSMFRSIEKENKVILERIVVKLKEKVIRDSSSINDVIQSLGLLLTLDCIVSPNEVASLYIEMIKKRWEPLIKNLHPDIKTSPTKATLISVSSAPSFDSPITQRISIIISQALKPLSVMLDSFQAYFFKESFEMPVSASSDYMIKHKNKMDTQNIQKLKNILTFNVNTCLEEVFTFLKEAFPIYNANEPSFNLIASFEGFDLLHKETAKMSTMVECFSIDTITEEFTMNYFDNIVQNVYDHIINVFCDRVEKTEVQSSIGKLESEMCKKIISMHDHSVAFFKGFLNTSEYHPSLSHCLMARVGGLSGDFERFWTQLYNSAVDRATDPFQLLVASRFMGTLSKQSIPTIFNLYEQAKLLNRCKVKDTDLAKSPSMDSFIPPFQRKITNTVDSLSLKIADLYTQRICNDISSALSDYLTLCELDFGKQFASPISVSPTFITLMAELRKVEEAATRIFPEKRRGSVSQTRMRHTYSAQDSQKEKNQFDGMFDKLFEEKMTYFEPVEKGYASILGQIFKMTLKHFLEEMRLCALDTFTHQQFQIDFEFWKQHMNKYLVDDQKLYSLVQEISSCCQHRCIEVKNIDPKVLTRIVFSAMPKMNERDGV